ncbi:MAG: CoA pyrophosphatase [Proteobacteria bacterium]|nr:CoA pyrophosphatase [Pseudomonadota bacterium]
MYWDQFRDILSRRPRKEIRDKGRIPSAVLLLLYEREGKCSLIFTKRTMKVANHKGQISFPGGVCEKEDDSVQVTALREAAEEVGINCNKVKILGLLDDCLTAESNYVITPVVGIFPASPRFKVNAEEVDRIIEIPLVFLQDFVKNEKLSNVASEKFDTKYPVFQYGEHVIWGATARILEQFLSLLVPLKENNVSGVIFEKGGN